MIPTARSLYRLLGHSRRWLVLSAALAAGQAALLIPVGLLIKNAFDEAIPDGDVGALVRVGVLLLALFIASGALGLWTRWIVLAATKEAIARLRMALLERLQTLPTTWFDRNETERAHAIVVQDSERVDVVANALAGQAIPAAIICAALAVALAIIDPLLFVLLGVTWPAMLYASRRLRPRVRRRTRAWQHAFDRFSARMHFALRGRSLIVTHSAEDSELRAGREEIRELSSSGLAMAWLQSLYGQVHGTLAAVSSVIVLVVGGAAVANGNTSLGSLISFYALLGLLRGQAGQLLAAAPQVISGGESLARLEEILEASDPPVYEGRRRIDFTGSFALRGVTFAYRDVPVLRGVELEAAPGEWVAVVGPNGAGKSTIASLVVGLYRPAGGQLLADGVPYDELDMAALRARIGVVAQDPILFPGSVAENIAYGEPGVDEARVRKALELASSTAGVESFAAGHETQIGDEGDLLSGGQRQSVALARALLRQPALLILDEPTSSLDQSAAPALLEALREVPWSPTVLLISHDPAVVGAAEHVYALDRGVLSPASAPASVGVALD
jgi:ABC-type multidrug transport system fused ATPase/permease subunit